MKFRREIGAMLPTQGPSVPVTSKDFSSVLSCATHALAFSNAFSQPVPVMFALAALECIQGESYNTYETGTLEDSSCNLRGSRRGSGR